MTVPPDLILALRSRVLRLVCFGLIRGRVGPVTIGLQALLVGVLCTSGGADWVVGLLGVVVRASCIGSVGRMR